MQSNYRPIGNYIQLVDERNVDLEIKTLLGLSISKQFIPSVANTVGTNMRSYKIIRKNQFACSTMQVRRDRKMPVALLKDIDEAIISQAYPVFEISDGKKLLPEYLMMWFSREEFDRQAEFLAVGGVRGTLEWEDFLRMELPVPSLEKQQEMVNEYNIIANRIKLNDQLNQKLEATAQALYKHWFVDFNFPITKESCPELVSGSPELEGKPYRSSGGSMVYNEELDKDIPEGWDSGSLKDNCEILDNLRKPISGLERETMQGKYPYYGAMGIVDQIDKYIFHGTYLLFSEDGVYVTDKNGQPSLQYVWGKFWVNNHAHVLKGDDNITTEYLKLALKNTNVEHLVTGAAQPKINQENMGSIILLLPKNEVLKQFNQLVKVLFDQVKIRTEQIKYSSKLTSILLSKMATVETEEPATIEIL